jgi:hypothetical protein
MSLSCSICLVVLVVWEIEFRAFTLVLYLLSHVPSPFYLFSFSDRVLCFWPRPALDCPGPTSVSKVAEIIDMNTHALFFVLFIRGLPLRFCLLE